MTSQVWRMREKKKIEKLQEKERHKEAQREAETNEKSGEIMQICVNFNWKG